MMEATARQTVLHNTIHKRKKQPPLSAHDRRKPLYQAVYALLPTGNSAGTAYLHCIKDGTNIEPCCDIGKSLLDISIFPFAECTPCSNPHCSRLLCEYPAVTRLSSVGQFLSCHSAGGYYRLHPTNGRNKKTVKKP